jgi:hypothetical protein
MSGDTGAMSSGRDDALVLRAPMPGRVRGTAIAGLTLALGGVGGGLYCIVFGPVLVGLVIAGWSAYISPSWWRTVRQPVEGREVLRMDVDGVTVQHGRGREDAVAWSTEWSQVRGLTVREVAVPEPVQGHLGVLTKTVSIDVLDHRVVDGPTDHRARLLPWALLTGTTTSRMRLQVLLAEVSPDGVGRLTAWLAKHRPEVVLDIDVTAPGAAVRQRVPSVVAVLVSERVQRASLLERLRQAGLQPEVTDAADVDALTEELRACTVLVAVDADPALLSEAAARAGVDRVLLAMTSGGAPATLVSSDRAWTILDASLDDEDPRGPRLIDHEGIAEAVVALLMRKDAVGRVWRIGPEGVPVVASTQT